MLNPIAVALKHLMDNGVTGDALVTAINDIAEAMRPAKTSSAERQQRYRDREKERNNRNGDVTSVTRNDSPPFNGFLSPTPPITSLNPPPYIPPTKKLSLPDWLPLEDWKDFVAMRRKGKDKFTDRAAKLLLKDLDELRGKGHDPGAVLQQSIKRGWAGVFEIKENYGGSNAKSTGNNQQVARPNGSGYGGKPTKHEVLNAGVQQVLADIASGKI